jgi:uncharacterized membrane protein
MAALMERSQSLLESFHPSHAVGRIAVSTAAGALAGLLLSLRFAPATAVLAGWSLGGAVLLVLAWLVIAKAGAQSTQQRAAADDPGRTVVYALVLLTSAVSLLAATPLVRGAKGLAPHESRLLVALCLATVALSWGLTHTAFTLRYAHLYYREDEEGVGGVEFPGGEPPSYFDFAYFAFTIGMCFQVSDVVVSSPQIRRAVLLHAVLSFVYNTVILAFVLNLAFGMAS